MYLSIFLNWESTEKKNKYNIITLNFGPQHPAAHGVLRLILQLKNEYIIKTDIHIGLLHRGTEYLIENKPLLLNIGYFDRLDYVSMLCQEHAYCLSIENIILTKQINLWKLFNRTLLDELTRILNHMLAVSCHALDLGSMNSLFWAFEERENIMEFYENICGARMHANYYKPNQNFLEINENILNNILEFSYKCFKTIQEITCILTHNKIWKQRLINIGTYGINYTKQYSLSGVMSRSTGIKKDLRINNPYSAYKYINFNTFIGNNGDCYDRFILRSLEMCESLNIILKSILWLKKNKIKFNLNNTNNNNKKKSIESIINEFKKWQLGAIIDNNISTGVVESPKGEFGITIYTNNNNNFPIRCKIRSSSLQHLNLLNSLSINHNLADLVALIGTIDIVFGEIDR